jgi:arsenate reductase-like glutaredoxin family protein
MIIVRRTVSNDDQLAAEILAIRQDSNPEKMLEFFTNVAFTEFDVLPDGTTKEQFEAMDEQAKIGVLELLNTSPDEFKTRPQKLVLLNLRKVLGVFKHRPIPV